MKLRYLMILAAFTVSSVACAADSPERTSPVDNNAACMDRTVDSSTGNCVVKDEGMPRHVYPGRPSAPVATSAIAPAQAPAGPLVRRSAVGSK